VAIWLRLPSPNADYPSNRGMGLMFGNFLIGTGECMAATVVQEFVQVPVQTEKSKLMLRPHT
jgi:hypothetical protein